MYSWWFQHSVSCSYLIGPCQPQNSPKQLCHHNWPARSPGQQVGLFRECPQLVDETFSDLTLKPDKKRLLLWFNVWFLLTVGGLCLQDAIFRQQSTIDVQDQPCRLVLVLEWAVYSSISHYKHWPWPKRQRDREEIVVIKFVKCKIRVTGNML